MKQQRTARSVAAGAVAEAAQRFPGLGPGRLDVEGLSGADARLALVIHRTVLQRWITLEHLLDHLLRQPMRDLEPRLRGVLLSGGAQVLFMDRLPVHAVVDESVELAKRWVRPGAGGLVNAVLRGLAGLIGGRTQEAWRPAADRVPLEGGTVRLTGAVLPDPRRLEEHFSIATSHPEALVRRWVGAYSRTRAEAVCLHGLYRPPVIVAAPGGPVGLGAGCEGDWEPHEEPGFFVWKAGQGDLKALLEANPGCRVQDPGSAEAIRTTEWIEPRTVLDYCAGRGTKTRQLVAVHPGARVWAAEPDPDRLSDLRESVKGLGAVSVVEPGQVVRDGPWRGADLVVVDVPCSNTAVLGRRPEARYRFSDKTLGSLVRLQRRIIQEAVPMVGGGGHLLYSTCSLEAEENRDQVRWVVQRYHAEVVRESVALPGGRGRAYHGGGYHALLRLP